jgi:hypothetical protein
MACHQRAGRGADQREDARGEELGTPGIELRARMARQRCQLEIEEGVDVQGAGLVVLEELDVAGFMHFAVEHALADQELRPLEIGIAIEQGVVEVE